MDWFFDHPEPLTPVGLMPMGGPDGAADVFGRVASNEPWLPTQDAGCKLDDLDLFLAEFNDGPSNPGDVEITGPGDTGWSNPPLDGGGNGGDGGPVTGGGGSGGPPPPPPDTDPYSACDDRKADELAEEARQRIANQPDSSTREYGFLIWRDAQGNLHLSNVIHGDNNALTGLNPSSVPSDFGFSSWDQVVGIVHSHPEVRYVPGPNGTTTTVNVQPGDGHHLPNQDDWDWPDFFVRQGASGANFSQYIVHGGQVHEYDLRDNKDGSRQTPATNPGGTCGS